MATPRSHIGWTDYSGGDANFIIGCEPISAGCKNCYARAIIEQRGGRDFSQVRAYPAKLIRLGQARFTCTGPGDAPYRRGAFSRPMVFVCDLSDLFHPQVDTSFIMQALARMHNRPDVDWQILTKRPARMAWEIGLFLNETRLPVLPDNIWPGVTVEDHVAAGRINYLLTIPSRRRFVSVEPMLEALPIRDLGGLAWVICGAESGPNRRAFERWWADELYDMCRDAGTPFFAKQAGGLHPGVPLLINGEIIVQEFPHD